MITNVILGLWGKMMQDGALNYSNTSHEQFSFRQQLLVASWRRRWWGAV